MPGRSPACWTRRAAPWRSTTGAASSRPARTRSSSTASRPTIPHSARASGGYFCTREIPLNTGVDFIGSVIKIALGEHVDATDLEPKRFTPIVQRYAFPEPGRVTRIAGLEDARRVPGIEELIVTVAPGDEIQPPTHSGCTAAMVLATGKNVAAARASATAALAALKIETARA